MSFAAPKFAGGRFLREGEWCQGTEQHHVKCRTAASLSVLNDLRSRAALNCASEKA